MTGHGVVRIVPVRVNSNYTARTLEQMLASKKQTHIAAFRYTLQELERDLWRACSKKDPSRLAKDAFSVSYGWKHSCEDLVQNILDECKQTLERHDKMKAEHFTNDEVFRCMVTEMLDVKKMAESKLNLWFEDTSQYIVSLLKVSLRDAHQQLLSFLRKQMLHEVNGTTNRQDTAMKLCRLKGLLDKSPDDIRARLTCAAADGISSSDMELLIEAHGLAGKHECSNLNLILSAALLKSAEFGHSHCVAVLMEANADVCFRDKDTGEATPLSMAASNGHAETVRMLIDAKADVKAADTNGYSPLYLSAQNGHAGALSWLLGANADVNATYKYGITPLYISARNGHLETMMALINAQADVNAANEDGYTPLYLAAKFAFPKAVKALLQANADVDATSPVGWTALWGAVESGDTECMQLLIQAGSDVMLTDSAGETVLMTAVCKEDWQSASLLLSQGGYSLLSAENCLGMTCLNMMPAGWSQDTGARTWIESVQAIDHNCRALVLSMHQETESPKVTTLERFRGHKWAVSVKSELGLHAVLFRTFSTVKASSFMCPSGHAAYYELRIVRMGLYQKFGFCTGDFEVINGNTFQGVGDDMSPSWGVDGGRLFKYHKGRHPFEGRKWQQGDVIGLACDLRSDNHALVRNQPTYSDPADQLDSRQVGGSMWVSVNGDFSPPYGLVFYLPQGLSGLFAAFTSLSGVVQCNVGEQPFEYAPPGEGFRPLSMHPLRPLSGHSFGEP